MILRIQKCYKSFLPHEQESRLFFLSNYFLFQKKHVPKKQSTYSCVEEQNDVGFLTTNIRLNQTFQKNDYFHQ